MTPKQSAALVSIGVSLLGALSVDFDAFLKYRAKHPGSRFDWAVMFGRLLKSLYVGLPGALGVASVAGE